MGSAMRQVAFAVAFFLAASPARAAVRTYALVVGVNTSVDKGVAPLHFADDDAAKYSRLFDHLADQTTLLTVFDADSRTLYKDLASRAKPPDRTGLDKAVASLRALAAKDHAAGNQVVVYFVYVGHGARDKSGEGYVSLVDRRLTRSDLHQLLIDPPADAATAFDTLHVIVDACSAYFVVNDRGGAPTPTGEDYSGRMGELFGPGAAPEKSPNAGFLLATTGDMKVHEWSAYRGGVFSHLVRSGLSGAADVDLDGKVTYAELGAFIAAASGEIKDPRARVDVTVSPPPAQIGVALSERAAFKPRQLVYLDPKYEGHYSVETEDGERLVDLNKPKGAAAVFALWGSGRYFLFGAEGESALDFSKRKVVATQSFTTPRKAERGSIDEEYRKALFSRPFDLSYYRAYCSLQRLPVPDPPGKPILPEELEGSEVAKVATVASPALARSTVAVLYFDYDGKGEELAVLKKGLAQMLVSDLTGHGGFTVVERERLQEVIDELNLNQSKKIDPATANKIGKLLGARYLVMGGYFELMGTLTITARAVETETARLVGEAKVSGKPDDFLQMEQKVAGDLGEALAKIEPTPSGAGGSTGTTDKPATRVKPPQRLATKTAVQFGKALEAIDRKDKEAAKQALQTVVKEQPDFVLASNELASLMR